MTTGIIQPASRLRRALGRWDLTAIGVNQVIGGAIFLMPSQVAAQIGAWSPIAFVLMGFASMTVALCFAEVGSRFDATGGPYLYTKAAFGRFAAFEVGWMQWFTRAASWASVINVLVVSLGFYWPSVTTGATRTLLLTGIIAALATVFARHDINIDAILQQPGFPEGRRPFVVSLNAAPSSAIDRAIREMSEFDFHGLPPVALPVLATLAG